MTAQGGDGGPAHDGTEGIGEIVHDLGGDIGVIDGYAGMPGGVEFVDEGADGEAYAVDVTGDGVSNPGAGGGMYSEMETAAGVDG